MALPTPVEQTDTYYRVQFGPGTFTLAFAQLTAPSGAGRAEQARRILQQQADFVEELSGLRARFPDDDELRNDPKTGRRFFADIYGDGTVADDKKTHMCEKRWEEVVVEWIGPGTHDYTFTWRVVA